MSDSLAIFTRAEAMLAEADTIQKAKELKTLALTAADWARRKGMGEKAIQHCRSYALEAERKMGQMLAVKPPEVHAGPGRGKRGDTVSVGLSDIPTLAQLGVPPKESERAQKLAALPEHVFQQIKTGNKTRKEIHRAQKREAVHALAKELNAKPVPLPDSSFDVIVVDPPWKYAFRSEDASHRAVNLYPEMTPKEIANLPIAKKAAKNCILWLWTTNGFMREAFDISDAWSFQVKTILTWGKSKMGLGDYLRGQTEHCLMCVQGKPLVNLTNQTTLLLAPSREHSRKPTEFFSLVEALCPGSKLEIFAREPRPGWQAWGAEISKFRGTK
jgi:N6-adenosine-specific RNA methylase IME4